MFVRFFYCKNTNNLLNFSIQPPRSAKNNCQTNSAQQDIAGGVHHIPWVTLRSPTAKSRRLAPPGSRPVRTYLHPRFLREAIPEGGLRYAFLKPR